MIASDGGAGAVVAWESGTGGPVEAVTRTGAAWSPPVALSTPGVRDPSVAMTATGHAFVAWQLPTSDGGDVIQVAERIPGGKWSAPVTVSAPTGRSRRPWIATDARSAAVVTWVRDTRGQDAVVEIAERTPTGEWSPPLTVSGPRVRARRPRLAVSPDGRAALTWEERDGEGQGAVVAATRGANRTWSTATIVSPGMRDAREPDVSIGTRGDLTVVWIGDDAAGFGTFVAERHGTGGWTAPRRLGSGEDIPRELSRPERAETGPDVAVLADGRAVAAWSLPDGAANRTRFASRDRDGSWGAASDLSGEGREAGGAQVAALAGGGAAISWEEVDGGLLRVRSVRVNGGQITRPCTDLAGGLAEYAGVRLAGGSAPTAALIDLNRDRVQAVPVP